MRAILIVGAVVALLARDGRAQQPRPVRAFEPSITTSVGVRNFGTRAKTVEGKATYSGSAEVGVRADVPLTRRTAFAVDLSIAPFAKQEATTLTSAVVREKVLSGTITGALAARLKPRAPVFFYGGVAAIYASKDPVPGVSGSSIEPALAFGAGYDAVQRGPWNLRAVFSNYLLKPSDPGEGGIEVESIAYDWAFQVGARYMPSRKDMRGAAR